MDIKILMHEGVAIRAEDPKKIAAIQRAISASQASGSSLNGLCISATRDDDQVLGKSLGHYYPQQDLIRLRHGIDWQHVASYEQHKNPVWAKKMYSGDILHLPLHEIGHAVHDRVSPDVVRSHEIRLPFSVAEQEDLLQELGHKYPAKCPAELVAEMYAAKVGGGHTFKGLSEEIYRRYQGPQITVAHS